MKWPNVLQSRYLCSFARQIAMKICLKSDLDCLPRQGPFYNIIVGSMEILLRAMKLADVGAWSKLSIITSLLETRYCSQSGVD